MSLIDRITTLLRRARPAATGETTLQTAPRAQYAVDMGRFQADTERREVIETCRKMYKTDPRAKEVVHALARDMTQNGFTVSVTDDARAADMAHDLITRLKLDDRLDDWTRLTLRDGDTFLEVGVDDQLQIALVTRKPTLEMHRNSNARDGFDDPARAFWWSDKVWSFEPPADALWFADWQMVHARWDHDEDSRYGRPLFASATAPWKRVVEGEKDIAVRRKTRAGMKYNHEFPPGTDAAVIAQYQEINKAAIENPLAAIADFFGTVKINTIQGDARLGEIDDVLHHIRTWWVASPIPMSLLGYGQDLNRDVLEHQKEQYNETLKPLRKWVAAQLVAPLVELEWLLHGIWPDTLTYEVVFEEKKVLTPQDIVALADAVLKLRALGLHNQAIAQLLTRFFPGFDWETLLDDPTAGNDAASRVANIMDKLRGPR